MPPNSSSADFREKLRDVAWSQWAALGVPADVHPAIYRMLDVEALVAFTAVVALDQRSSRDPVQPDRDAVQPHHVDARLLHGMLDWLCRNGELVSLQRLRNIQRDKRFGWVAPFEATVAWIGEHSTLRWRALPPPPHGPHEAAATNGGRAPDPTYARYGVFVPSVTRNRIPAVVQLDSEAAAALRLRCLCGVGANAEVVRVLVGAGDYPTSLSDVSGQAGFAKRNVRTVLDAMESAGFVASQLRGRERVYQLVDGHRWRSMLRLDPHARFPNWFGLLRFALAVASWSETAAHDDVYVRRSLALDVVERDFQDLVRDRAVDLGLVHDLPIPTRAADALEFLDALAARILAALQGESPAG